MLTRLLLTTSLRLRVLLLAVFLGGTSASVRLSAAAPSATSPTLLVYVQDAAGPGLIPGATVRVLSKQGVVLVEAVTDEAGEALVTKPAPALEPTLILVERRGFYIGGTHWSPGADETCVHLALLRTCCRTLVTAQ